jgi:uncharacterized tellurite resistance protein B-like protein
MGKQKQANQAARKAASDGKITQKEAAKVQKVASNVNANAAIAIAKAAANNQARIAESVQQQLGLDQTKRGVNYNPLESNVLYGGPAIKPGVAPITGFENHQTRSVNGGSANHQAPVYTFFNKKKSGVTSTTTPPAEEQPAAADGGEQKPMNNMTEQWDNSVDSGLAEMQAILKQQMEANAEQTTLYMGMMQDMMSQMQTANASPYGQMSPQGAYASTTYQVAPAAGAQQTQEITRKKPVANTSLSIGASPELASGVGLNLAI